MDLHWLGRQECHDVSMVGGKAASLSRLAADYCVPPGFCLTTAGLAHWVEIDGIGVPPDRTRQAVARAYQELGERCGQSQPSVAVRSSAVDEDGQTASFAGQYDTCLNVSGFDSLLLALGRCRASLRSPRVVEYRRRNGLPIDRMHLAVLVQQLVPSDVSAVMFTANPVSSRCDEIVINASWGLGESIVGGTVTPDMIVVRKGDLTITSHCVAEKRRMTVAIPGGTREADVPRVLRTRAALHQAQILEMARLGLSLETRLGRPVDVECAWHGGRLYLLQCRPITTLP